MTQILEFKVCGKNSAVRAKHFMVELVKSQLKLYNLTLFNSFLLVNQDWRNVEKLIRILGSRINVLSMNMLDDRE